MTNGSLRGLSIANAIAVMIVNSQPMTAAMRGSLFRR